MKKLVSITLLFCLFLTVVGHHVVFHIQQSVLKAEMKKIIRSSAKMEGEELLIFPLDDQVSLSRLEWEDDHEFRLDGRMYDVIEKKIEAGKLIIRCLSDERETALIKKFEQVNKSNTQSKNKAALLFKLITNSYITISGFTLEAGNMQHPERPLMGANIFSRDRSDVLTPPPQLG